MTEKKEPIRLSTWIIVSIAVVFILGYLYYQSETFASILNTIIIVLVVAGVGWSFYRVMQEDYNRYHIEEEEMENKKSDQIEDELRCPKCGSANIYVNKKGYSAGGGCMGAILFGPLGLLCGQSGANKIQKTCLKCNKNFN